MQAQMCHKQADVRVCIPELDFIVVISPYQEMHLNGANKVEIDQSIA
jgi:hypothetical protein